VTSRLAAQKSAGKRVEPESKYCGGTVRLQLNPDLTFRVCWLVADPPSIFRSEHLPVLQPCALAAVVCQCDRSRVLQLSACFTIKRCLRGAHSQSSSKFSCGASSSKFSCGASSSKFSCGAALVAAQPNNNNYYTQHTAARRNKLKFTFGCTKLSDHRASRAAAAATGQPAKVWRSASHGVEVSQPRCGGQPAMVWRALCSTRQGKNVVCAISSAARSRPVRLANSGRLAISPVARCATPCG
jgi:hypothetical protein